MHTDTAHRRTDDFSPTADGRQAPWRRALSGTAVTLTAALMTIGSAPAVAGPQGGDIVGGNGSINRTGGNTTVITQRSGRLAINWDSFNIGRNERVIFDQPSSQATALNRILDSNPSRIFGAIDANGRVFLLNRNGIVFGRNAKVRLGALVATTLDLDPGDFMRGNYDLTSLADRAGGMIINRGVIEAAAGGSVTLVGESVVNEGLILADYGEVNLAAGRSATLDFDGDGLMLFSVDEEVLSAPAGADAAVENKGQIVADGGRVLLTAQTASGVFDNVVNNGGLIRAAGIENVGGEVRLVGAGGTVRHSGSIDVSGETGGRVEVLGERVGLFGDASIDASGDSGGGTVLVGGDQQGLNPDVMNATATYVGEHTSINADAHVNGDGGRVIVYAADTARIYGDLSVSGGERGGDGGFVETSGGGYLQVTRTPDITAADGRGGEWLIDPRNIQIVAGNGNTNINDTAPFAPTGDDAQLGVELIEDALGTASGATVTITTAGGGTQDGNITWTGGADLDYNTLSTVGQTDTLRLTAENDIIFENGATIADSANADDRLNLQLRADRDVDIQTGSSIDLQGGVFDVIAGLDEAGEVTIAGTVLSGAGSTISGGANNDIFNIDSAITADISGLGGDDEFNIDAAVTGSLIGGDNNDTFNIASTVNGGAATAVQGNAGDDTLSFSTETDPVAVVLTAQSANGFNGTATGLTSMANGFAGIFNLDGSASGSDSLTGRDATSTWDLDATPSYTQGTRTLDFSLFENLNGGSGTDTFNLTSGVTFSNLSGGGGVGDILNGTDDATTWTIDAANEGDAGGQDFDSFEVLNGGDDVDEFIIGGNVTGSVNGFGESDIFRLADGITVGSINGGTGLDTLFGGDGNNVFTISSTNGGDLDGQTFTSVATLEGGGGNDRFEIGANVTDSINGGTGNDTFNVNAAVDADLFGDDNNDIFNVDNMLTGTIDGGINDDDIFLAADVTGDVRGGNGTDEFFITAAVSADLFGNNGIDTFTIDADANPGAQLTGNMNGGGGTLDRFVLTADPLDPMAALLIGDANGGIGNDRFEINGVVQGRLIGGDGGGTDLFLINGTVTSPGGAAIIGGADSGNDTIDYSVNTGPVDVVIVSADADGYQGQGTGLTGTGVFDFTGIETIIGSGDAADTLTGANTAGTWSIGATTTYELAAASGALSFSAFESLFGGTNVDTFNILTADFPDLNISGGNGADIFNLTDGVTLTNDLDGGNGDDTLVGDDAVNVWTVDSANGGNVNGQGFTSFEILSGGSFTDTFNLDADLSVAANGFGGNDIFNLANGVTVGLMDGGGSDASGDILNADDFTNNWVVDSDDGGNLNGSGFASIEVLNGGNVVDNFDIDANVTGSANGNDGNDVFDLGGAATVVSVDGGNDDDTVTSDGDNTWTIDGAEAGNVNGLAFANAETLLGGAGADNFVLDGGSFNGLLDGGDGVNTVTSDGAQALSSWSLTGSRSGMLTADAYTAAFERIDIAQGGAGVDSFDVAATFAGTADGGAGEDEFVLNAGATVATLLGGDDTDTIFGVDAASDWTIGEGGVDNAGSVTYGGVTQTFAEVETAAGGTATDTFNLDGGLMGLLDGGTGDPDEIVGGTDNVFVVNGTDAGTANDIAFVDVENLTGGDGVDDVTVQAGNGVLISGTIDTGDGDDVVLVDYDGAGDRSLTIVGGAGTGDELQFTGAPAGAAPVYDAATGTMTLATATDTQTVTFDGFETVSDTVTAQGVTFLGGTDDELFTLAAGAAGGTNPVLVTIDGVGIDVANKDDLTIDAGDGNDTIDVAGSAGVPGTIEFGAESITNTGGGTLSAAVLRLVGASIVGADGAALLTGVDQLELVGLSGDAFIDEEDALELLASDTSGNLDLATGGNLTQSGALSVGGDTTLDATGSDIVLDDAGNDFTGTVSVAGAANATLADANDLTLGDATATGSVDATAAATLDVAGTVTSGTAALTSTGGQVTQSAGAVVATALSVNAAQGVTLDGANQVASLTLANASGDASFSNDAATLAINGVTQGTGNVSVTNTGGLDVAGAVVSGSGVTLNSGGTVTGAGRVSAASLNTVSVGGTTLTGANTVAALNATNSGSGDIVFANTAGTLSIGGVSQSGGGGVDISNSGNMSVDGDVTAAGGGAVALTASGAFSQVAAITTAAGAVDVNAGTGINMNAASSTTSGGGDIGYCTATGDVILALLDAGTGDVLVKSADPSRAVSIASTNGANTTNIIADNVVLNTLGTIGGGSDFQLQIEASPVGLIEVRNAASITVRNINLTETVTINTLSDVNDPSLSSAISAFATGQSAGLTDIGFIDESLFDTTLEVYSVVGRGVLLPCDQLEEEDARCE